MRRCRCRPRGAGAVPVRPLEAGHGGDAEDPGRADSDARLDGGLLADAEQADLPHVAVAVAHPHLVGVLWAAVAGRSTRKLEGGKRQGEVTWEGSSKAAARWHPDGQEGCLNKPSWGSGSGRWTNLHPTPCLHDGDGLEELWVQTVFAGSWENRVRRRWFCQHQVWC